MKQYMNLKEGNKGNLWLWNLSVINETIYDYDYETSDLYMKQCMTLKEGKKGNCDYETSELYLKQYMNLKEKNKEDLWLWNIRVIYETVIINRNRKERKLMIME